MTNQRYTVKAYSFNGILGEQYENLTDMEMNEVVNDLYKEKQYGPINIMISKNGGKFRSARELLGL